MKTNYLLTVSTLSGKNLNELERMSTRHMVDNIVLPLILFPSGQNIRGWRIGDSFMNLMAEFGEYCYQQDSYTGEILLEIALQRLSNGAILHEQTSFNVLPPKYQKYGAQYDQPGLMSNSSWSFLCKQYTTCLEAKLTREHTKKIIFGLIDHLDDKGNTLGDFSLGGTDFKTSPQEVFNWAWTLQTKISLLKKTTNTLPHQKIGNGLRIFSKKIGKKSTTMISLKKSEKPDFSTKEKSEKKFLDKKL